MNKQKFVEFLRKPHSILDSDLEDIQKTIEEFPYFQSARTILAKTSRIKNTPSAKSNISKASIYATDRAHLKKYIVGDLIFLRPLEVHDSNESRIEEPLQDKNQPSDKLILPPEDKSTLSPQAKKVEKEKVPTKDVVPTASLKQKEAVKTELKPDSSAKKAEDSKQALSQETKSVSSPTPETKPKVADNEEGLQKSTDAPKDDLDNLIDDIFSELEALKENRAKLIDLEKKIEEEDAVNDAVEKATKKALDTAETKEKKPTPKSNPKNEDALEAPATSDTPIESSEEKQESVKEPEVSDKTERAGNKAAPAAKTASPKKAKSTAKKAAPKKTAVKKKEADKTQDSKSTEEEQPKAAKTARTARKATKKATSTTTKKTTDGVGKISKGESAIDKAAAKMRASGKIKKSDEPQVKKGVNKVNNTPPEKIIKTYIRKRSSERSNNVENGDDKQKSSGKEDDKPAPAPVKKKSNDLIDQFIENQPSIIPNKNTEEITLGDLSEKSTEFNPEIASEYLAEIFLEQGKKEMAISIYEQLILKFPDKSIYFADIIKKLKD